MKRLINLFTIICLFTVAAQAQPMSEHYNREHPLVFVGDWDNAPYEFLNDRGQPDGINIEILSQICKELGISYRFVLKEWSTALKSFERGDADLILANSRRFTNKNYYSSKNIVAFNRISVATTDKDAPVVISYKELLNNNIALKADDYATFFFRDLNPEQQERVDFLGPKTALQGISDGIYKYFIWSEEALKWKIKQLHLEGIYLREVQIPVSEVHFIGHEEKLIDEIDDIYSRMKQRGDVQRITDKWLHPERSKSSTSPWILFYSVIVLLVIAVFWFLTRVARTHVRKATRLLHDQNKLMSRALHMGNFHVMEYDIRHDRWTNSYGSPLLPDKGITLNEFAERMPKRQADEFKRKMERLLNGRDRKFELRKRWKSFEGDWLNFDGHAIVELDDDGQPSFVINVVNDVTQNVEENRSAHEMSFMFQQLSKLPFVAMSFYDKDGWLIELNNNMKQLCGYSDDDPAGARYWNSVCMFDIPLFRNAYSPYDRNDLLVCQHMKYDAMNIDKYIEFSIQPLINAQDEVVSYFVSAVDISDERKRDHDKHAQDREIKRINNRIDRYENWMNFLTKNGNTYMWYSNIEQQTSYYYRSLRSLGTDHITLPFDVHVAHMEPADRVRTLELLNNQLPNQKPFESIQHFNSTVVGGGESWFRISGSPIFDLEGHVIGHRGQSLDITQEMSTKKQLEKEEALAKESMRLKSGFMASMTHELRTPLNAIIGFTDILATISAAEEREEYIRIIRTNCDMLQRLINDILVASSLSDSLSTIIEEEDIDFSEEFDDICLMLKQRVQNNVEFITENPYQTFYTRIDKARVAQVITNFVTNAVKFTQKGSIKLGYRYERRGLRIYCTDTGAGISKDKQDVIFERFVKLDEFVQGTGMGLNICKSIAERCGGQVGVYSDGPGTGSTFWMWIPCERKLNRTVTNE